MPETISFFLKEVIDFSKSKTNCSYFTKSFIQEYKGTVPVYGASLDENEVSYGYVQDALPNIKYFDDCLTWNIDGSSGVFYRKGHFSLSEKVIPLLPYDKYKTSLDLVYIKYSIMYSKEFAKFGFSNKAGKGKLGEMKIHIPILPDGTFDLQKQKELAKKYQLIEEKKRLLLAKIELLNRAKVVINNDCSIRYENVSLTELFTPEGGDMKLSKEWCKSHKGTFPVYSGSTSSEIFSHIDNYKYDGDYLSWIIDGLAGYLMIIKGKFSITCHRGVLIPTDKCKNVDLQYIKYAIEPIFRERARGRIGINRKNEYTALKPTHIKIYNDVIPIPVNADGAYDLEKQKELADKYVAIQAIKENVYRQIQHLTSVVVV